MKAPAIYRDDREKSDYPRGGFCLTLSGETGRPMIGYVPRKKTRMASTRPETPSLW